MVAGHINECGAQASGGNTLFDWRGVDLVEPGYPIIDVELEGVSMRPDPFPIPVTVERGRVRVVPVFETLEQDGPSRIELELDAELSGDGVIAATVSGALTLPPNQPPEGIAFDSELDVTVERFEMRVLPERGREIRRGLD